MLSLPESLSHAIDHFSRFQGVGQRTATRQVLQMMGWREDEIASFAKSVEKLSEVKRCESCGFFSEQAICEICSNDQRVESKTLCLVERETDVMAVENSEKYRGVYHVLGGVLNPMMGIGPAELRMKKLFERIKRDEIQTVILAVNPSVEGDATCSYIKMELENMGLDFEVSLERIGFGMPMGGALEFLDPLTINKALENRKTL